MNSEIQSNRIEYTLGMGKANLYAFFLFFPIILIFLLPYALIWGYESFELGKNIFMHFMLPILILGIVVHEFLHGVTWAFYAKNGFKSIRFGMNWKWLTPYCHCKESLKVKHYALGAAMPLIVMGILPIIIAFVLGNGMLLAFGIFFTWAAGGDIIALFMLIRISKNSLVYDHPDKMGFYIEK